MKFSYVSDLHLEFKDYPDFSKEDGGDVLLLAGDIITTYSLVSWRTDKHARSYQKYMTGPFKNLIDKYDMVLMVLGNHEHYNYVFQSTKKSLEGSFERLGLNKIKILDNDTVRYHDVNIIGSTLWSDFEKASPISMANVQRGMNDYRIIYDKDPYYSISSQFTLDEHYRSVQYIKHVLREDKDNQYVVMTHHGPTYQSLNMDHVGNGLDGGYCSDLSELILDNLNIKFWISGHTHIIQEYDVGSTKVLANCRGYYGEQSYKLWNGLRHFQI